MNSAPEDFDRLCRWLALKRHEQPPPGYFNEFPRRVIVRLEAAQSAESVSWFEQWVRLFRGKPVFAGGFAVATFGLLLFGLVAFQQLDETPVAMVTVANDSMAMIPSAHAGMALNQFPTSDVLQSSINPAINAQPPSALFDGFHLNVQSVSLRPDGN